MVKAKFVVYYYELEDEVELRRTLKGYLTLFSPDVTTLTDALLQVSYSSQDNGRENAEGHLRRSRGV